MAGRQPSYPSRIRVERAATRGAAGRGARCFAAAGTAPGQVCDMPRRDARVAECDAPRDERGEGGREGGLRAGRRRGTSTSVQVFNRFRGRTLRRSAEAGPALEDTRNSGPRAQDRGRSGTE